MAENFGRTQQHAPAGRAVANNISAGGKSLPAANGLPVNLKAGVESLSGISLDDVSVHYNSDRPAQMKAFAYAQGNEIHVGPGQEKHLPHEAWHVVQQKQGRVQATRQMKSIAVNDDAMLEHEADVMGAKALQTAESTAPLQRVSVSGSVAQLARRTGMFGIEAEVVDGVFIIGALKGSEGQNLIESENITLEEFSLGEIDGKIDVTLDNEMKRDNEKHAYRQYVIEFVQKAVDAMTGEPDEILRVADAWKKAGDFWRAAIADRHLLHGRVSEDWYTVNPTWKGDQFDNGDGPVHPGVASTGQGADKEFEFDWRHHAFTSYISVDKEDPAVSAQATAGSSLGALLETYLITNEILTKGKPPEEAFWTGSIYSTQRRNEVLRPAASALNGLLFILRSYVTATGGVTKRYAKEYLAFMSRTSLDMAFSQLSDKAKEAFIVMVAEYLSGKPGNQLNTSFGKAPTDRVFTPDTSKEEQAHSITIEDMLLSIINKKKDDISGNLVEGDHAAGGDVFSENNLAGISEINPGSPEAIEKFKLNAANEMMRGEAGVIFESRAAKTLLLSEMPGIFIELYTSLQRMDVIYNDTVRKVREEQAPPPQRQLAQAPKEDDNKCIVM